MISNKLITYSLHLDPEVLETGTVNSDPATDLSSVFDRDLSRSSSAGTSFVDPLELDNCQIIDEVLSLIRHESLLGPLLMSLFLKWELNKSIATSTGFSF